MAYKMTVARRTAILKAQKVSAQKRKTRKAFGIPKAGTAAYWNFRAGLRSKWRG